jgi:TetR/AcrR family transcriptional regulator
LERVMGIRAERKEKRRNEILIKALGLFSSKGYTETKITDIAGEVNMSAGLLFHYFESKEELYSELIRIGIDYINERTRNLVKLPIDYFECAIDMVLSLFKSNPLAPKWYLLIRRALILDNAPERIKEQIRESFDRIVKINEERIILGQKRGEIRQADSQTLTMFLFSCLDGIAESCVHNPSLPLPQTEWILDIIKKHG